MEIMIVLLFNDIQIKMCHLGLSPTQQQLDLSAPPWHMITTQPSVAQMFGSSNQEAPTSGLVVMDVIQLMLQPRSERKGAEKQAGDSDALTRFCSVMKCNTA